MLTLIKLLTPTIQTYLIKIMDTLVVLVGLLIAIIPIIIIWLAVDYMNNNKED